MLKFRVIDRVLTFTTLLTCTPDRGIRPSLIELLQAMETFPPFRQIMLIFLICGTKWKLNLLLCQLMPGVNLIMMLISMSPSMAVITGLSLSGLLLVIVAYLQLVNLSMRR